MISTIQKLVNGQQLTFQEAEAAMAHLMNGECSDIQIAAFLTALAAKGETSEELTAFARIMREKAVQIKPSVQGLVDTCGTGGDSSHTFNISTAAAIIAAGAGVKIAKHGNRASSGKCGSADVLETVGVKMLQPLEVQKCIESIGIGFMFAPYFHPAMKYASAVRKALGIKTVFNLLGPLTNPAGANAQLLGVYSRELLVKMAKTLNELGTQKALLVNGNGIDELILGKTDAVELENDRIKEKIIDSSEFGFSQSAIPTVNSANESKNILMSVLNSGEGPARDVALLNAGAAIYVSGRCNSIAAGITLAEKAVDSGKAMEKLEQLKSFEVG